MKKEYSKPELIDLNEQTGLGSNCRNGSGEKGLCTAGTIAGSGCNAGTGHPD